ncbi:MAG: hypothetical protein QGF68_11355, partial [Nitrospinota bacterium]|nr:hypothetical protein [Nitrospinota bacterium]
LSLCWPLEPYSLPKEMSHIYLNLYSGPQQPGEKRAMDSYRLFLDGIAVGVFITLAGGYLLLRLKQSLANRSKDDID